MSDPSEGSLSNVDIRAATINDIPEILRQRCAMYEDMGHRDADTLEQMASLSADYLARAMSDGSFRAWLASAENRFVAGGAIIISPWPAHPYDLEWLCTRVPMDVTSTNRWDLSPAMQCASSCGKKLR
jgi:hypothetical protein